MTTYLAGDYERVWADLMALGAGVRDEPVYADALAVARETMRRARHNIEVLIPRLEAIGYRFGYDWLQEDELDFAEHQPPVFAPAKPDVQERIGELEALAGVLPLSLRAWYETVGAVNFVGAPPDAWQNLGSEGFSGAAFQGFLQAHPEASAEEVQQFVREHPEFTASIEKEVGLDPLQVFSIEDHIEMARYERERVDELPDGQGVRDSAGEESEEVQTYNRLRRHGKFFLMIAPDNWHKYAISGLGAYEIGVPDPAADTRLFLEWHHTTVVNYLRICFRWGGFPGLERAHRMSVRDLAFLTHDLLPL